MGILIISVVAMGVSIAMGNRVDSGPVPSSTLSKGMFSWGSMLGQPGCGLPVFAVVGIVFIVLASGMSQIEQDRGAAWDWVPSGGRFERQLKEWDHYVDDSVTDRTTAYIQVRAENGENLLDDPGKWLEILFRTVKAVYGEAEDADDAGYTAEVRATNIAGEEKVLSWKDFCFSINHPLLVAPIPGISNGTGMNFKPCIQSSVLDSFYEQVHRR